MTNYESPSQLKPQKPEVPKHKKILYKIIAVLFVLFIIVFISISFSGQKEKQLKIKETKITENKTLLPLESDGRGLATLKIDEKRDDNLLNLPLPPLKEDEKPLFTVVGPLEKDPIEEALRLEREEIKRQKREYYYSAINAPVLAKRLNIMETSTENVKNVNNINKDNISSSDLANTTSNYDPTADRDKEGFFQRADATQWISPYSREAGRPFELKTGTVIQGTMVSGINSDLPGNLIAQVSQNIYDSTSGNSLLIPQGSKLYGVYDSRVVYGQQRVLIAWNRVIFPDGSSVTLGAMPGTDMAGYSGFKDKIDNHYLRIFGSAILMSLITGGTSYAMDNSSNSSNDSNKTTVQDAMASAIASQMGQATLSLLEKNLNIKPTLEISPGYRFNIVITKDIVFKGAYDG